MSGSPMSLDQIQRLMWHAVQQPLTPEEYSREKTLQGESMNDIAEKIIKPNDRLTSFERLEIYNRQYWFRILTALYEDFPGLRGIIGEKQFEKLSIAYLTDNPSRSFTLRDLGSRLPEWLKNHLVYVPKHEQIAYDMVRLEWAEIEAFDNAEKTKLSEEDLKNLGPDPKFQLQPYVMLLDMAYPVNDLLLKIREHEEENDIVSNAMEERPKRRKIHKIALPRPKKTYLAVHRQDGSVYFKDLEPEAFAVLKALQHGESLSEAVGQVNWRNRPVEKIGANIQEWFANWSSLGWFCKD